MAWGPDKVFVRCDGCHATLPAILEGPYVPVPLDTLPAVLKLHAWASMRVAGDDRTVELCPGCYDLDVDDAGDRRLTVREHARGNVPDAPLARSLS